MGIENVHSSTTSTEKSPDDTSTKAREKTSGETGKRKVNDSEGPDSPTPHAERIRTVPPREPLDAMEDYGPDDISRQERAEEAIRQHFRDLTAKAQESNRVDRKA